MSKGMLLHAHFIFYHMKPLFSMSHKFDIMQLVFGTTEWKSHFYNLQVLENILN